MVNVLYNVVRKIIEPKYPWIKDFVWSKHRTGGFDYYTLEVTVDKDFYMNRTDPTRIHNSLYKDTKMLFDMIGPERDMYFDDVIIQPEK